MHCRQLPILSRNGVLLQRVHLLEEREHVHHASITNDALCIWLNDANRNQMERYGLSIDDDGMSGISTSGGTAAEVVSTRKSHFEVLRTCLQSYPQAFPFPRHPTGNPSLHPPLTYYTIAITNCDGGQGGFIPFFFLQERTPIVSKGALYHIVSSSEPEVNMKIDL